MKITATQIAQLINGIIDGDPDVVITGPSKIEETQPETISFLANLKYEDHLYTSKAAAIVVSKDFMPKQPTASTLIRVDDVYVAIAHLFDHFAGAVQPPAGISNQAIVHPDASIPEDIGIGHFTIVERGAKIGKGSRISAQVFIGASVEIGENVIIYPGVKIYHDCKIGNNCIIHSNAVIGSDGFGFAPQEDGTYKKIHQLGIVIVEDNVEIGACTTLDRGMMEPTIVKKGVKLDNLVQIAHNVEVGENTVIAAQSGIAGSAKLGKNIRIGGQVAIVGHITVADKTSFQGKTGVGSSITKPGTSYWGVPAISYMEYAKAYVKFRTLPEMEKRLRELEKKVGALTDDSNK